MHGNFGLFPFLYPSPRGFPWFFFAKEIKSKPRSGNNESRKQRGEREKPLVTLASNLSFMQTTAVKRLKLLIKRVTNGNLANTCLSAAIFLSGGRPGEIMLWTNHLHLGGKEWFVNRGQAKACVCSQMFAYCSVVVKQKTLNPLSSGITQWIYRPILGRSVR